MNTVRAAAVRVMPPATEAVKLNAPYLDDEVAATKSGNPLCDKSHVELTLRVMPPATETVMLDVSYHYNKAAA